MQIANMSEDQARGYIETVRWPDGPICPHCGNQKDKKIYKLQGKSVRPGLYKCGACRRQFSVTVGTVMHSTHIMMKQWLFAFYMMCSDKKGIAALEFYRKLDLGSYQTAWFLAHRIRAAMEEKPLKDKLSGTVEADETFVGGPSREGRRGHASERKTPVMVIVERDGEARVKVVPRTDGRTLKQELIRNVEKSSTLMTDEMGAYYGMGKYFLGGHHVVRHSHKEFSRGEVSSNTAESFFANLKRGYVGVYHYMSKKHLQRYCHEFAFRWNFRKLEDEDRAVVLLKSTTSKRLTYKQLLTA